MAAGRHRVPRNPGIRQQLTIKEQRKAEAEADKVVKAVNELAAGVTRAWNGGA